MEHMTPLDAAFLEGEDEEPGVSLAVSATGIFTGPPPTQAEFTELVASRLATVPRYRQKVREVPLDLAAPVWIDDEHFDLAYHLRRAALPAPGGDPELAALIGRVMSTRLDRDHPLWEYWLVEGLAGDRWALICKVHHCLVDGVSGVQLYTLILDEAEQGDSTTTDDWEPWPEPTSLALVKDALPALALGAVRQAGLVLGALGRAREVGSGLRTVSAGLRGLSAALRPADRTSLTGPLCAQRRFAWSRLPLADVRAVRHALGGTVNDVALAAITSGLRALLLARGETPRPHSVRSLVPVSLRATGEEGISGNRVSAMLAWLPVHLGDPVERLSAVRTELDQLKAGKETESVAMLTDLATREPFPLLSVPFRLLAHLPQRSVVTVTTNVPGPRRPLHALGRELVELIPYVPIASTVRIGVSIFGYRDTLTVGLTGDYDSTADIETLARGVEHGLAELTRLAQPRQRRPRSGRASSTG